MPVTGGVGDRRRVVSGKGDKGIYEVESSHFAPKLKSLPCTRGPIQFPVFHVVDSPSVLSVKEEGAINVNVYVLTHIHLPLG